MNALPVGPAAVPPAPGRSKRPLRVLITSQYFWPEPFRISDLARGLVERGHDVTVLTGLPNYPVGAFSPGYGIRGPWRERYAGVDVKRVPLVPRGGGGRARLILNYLSFAAAATALGAFRCRRRYDVVLVNQPSPMISALPGLFLARLKRLPAALWVQDLWPESLAIAGVRSQRIWQLMERTMRFVYRHSDLVLIQSRAFRSHALCRGVASGPIRYLPNWAEPHFKVTDRSLATAEDAELPRGFRVVFAGNLGAAQSLETIVEAAVRLRDRPDIQIVALGDGRRRGWLEAEIAARKLSATLHCLGPRPNERMPFYYAVADALLVTLKRDETMARTIPSRLQPYLASGRPIIAALDGEAQRIVVSSGSGLGCPSEDPEALAAAITTLAASPLAVRATMGRAAAACYEREFERGKLLDDLEGWLLELVASRS